MTVNEAKIAILNDMTLKIEKISSQFCLKTVRDSK